MSTRVGIPAACCPVIEAVLQGQARSTLPERVLPTNLPLRLCGLRSRDCKFAVMCRLTLEASGLIPADLEKSRGAQVQAASQHHVLSCHALAVVRKLHAQPHL